MCITSEDIRSQEEELIWDILCDECRTKTVKLLKKRRAIRLFDIDIEDYQFCPKCTAKIDDELREFYEAIFVDEEVP